MKPNSLTGSGLAGLEFEEWLALKFWMMGASALSAVQRLPIDSKPEGVEPHHYLAQLKTRAIAIARANERHELVSLLRNPQPASEKAMKRVREALDTIEKLPLQITPKPDDQLTKWIPARAAMPLINSGCKTLAELNVLAVDPRWHKKVPRLGRVGRKACESLLETLKANQQLAVIEPPKHRLGQAWRSLAAGTAPERLDGRLGRFRGPAERCSLEADRDYRAIETWLKSQSNDLTLESYRKEMMRVLLWATVVCGKAFSDLTVEDAGEYREFLKDPQPAAEWVGPRKPIESVEWRPFAQPLGESSRRYALQVIRTCARWLREQNYLITNPWASMRTAADESAPIKLERIPSRSHWAMVRRLADDLENREWETDAAARCRFVLDFLRGTGLRVSEFAQLRLGDIYQGEPGEWFIRVKGKGGKTAVIDLLPVAKSALEQYLIARGLSALIDHNDPGLPVVSTLESPSTPIQRKSLWAVINRFRKLAAVEFKKDYPGLARQLEKMSPHTMRHIFGSHALENGAQLNDVQEGLRHANIKTTSGYVHSDTRKRRIRLSGAIQ